MIPRRKIIRVVRRKTWADAYNYKIKVREESNNMQTCLINGDDTKGYTIKVVNRHSDK